MGESSRTSWSRPLPESPSRSTATGTRPAASATSTMRSAASSLCSTATTSDRSTSAIPTSSPSSSWRRRCSTSRAPRRRSSMSPSRSTTPPSASPTSRWPNVCSGGSRASPSTKVCARQPRGSLVADRPRVSVVVVNYNARQHLLECLGSLRSDGVDEIIVVDNASSDGSLEAVAGADPEVVVLPTGGNLGFGSAANRGLAVARGEYVAILNPDVVVESGTMKALAAALDADPALGAVAPRVDNPDGPLYPPVRPFPSMTDAIGHAFLGFIAPRNRFSRRYRLLDLDHSRALEVDWVSGTCLMLRSAAVGDEGRFDESYFMYVEDVDLCWRLRAAGWRIG